MGDALAGLKLLDVGDVPEDYGRWLIHGPQGSGKSTLASTIATFGKTLFIDTVGEKGVRSFRGAAYERNIKVYRPKSATEFDDLFYLLRSGDHDYRCVVIDSLTGIQKKTNRYMLGHEETAMKEIKQGTAPADMRTWGQSLDVMVDVATFWYGLADGDNDHPMHVVMTAQSKMNENEFTGETTMAPDVQKGALSTIMSTPDYILFTDLEDDPEAMGDDTIPPQRHIVRFGGNTRYRMKSRVPVNLRGKIPTVLGRKTPTSLATLSKVLEVGGVPKPKAKAPAPKTTAATAAAKKPAAAAAGSNAADVPQNESATNG